MKVIYKENQKVPIKLWAENVSIEDAAIEQLRKVASLPFIYKHIAGMPDLHVGAGCCVGSVIATTGAIVPANVGVDLGCGMMAVQTDLTASDLPNNLTAIRSLIESKVPHGRTNDGGKGDRGT